MWLVKVVRDPSGKPELAQRHYECKVCDAVTIAFGMSGPVEL
jgi:hypothetical protein